MHAHARMASRIMFIAGKMVFRKDDRAIDLGAAQTFRSFPIAAGQLHGATVTGRFGIFLNLETWNSIPTSAAHDFVRA